MSDEAMAASQAFIILLSLSFMQAIGISVAASTLVGRYIGAKEPLFRTPVLGALMKQLGKLLQLTSVKLNKFLVGEER